MYLNLRKPLSAKNTKKNKQPNVISLQYDFTVSGDVDQLDLVLLVGLRFIIRSHAECNFLRHFFLDIITNNYYRYVIFIHTSFWISMKKSQTNNYYVIFFDTFSGYQKKLDK